MIVFDLLCKRDHRFEIWFRSSSDYQEQLSRKLISCPVCGTTEVRKAITAPRVSAKSNQRAETPAQPHAGIDRAAPAADTGKTAQQAHLPTASMDGTQRQALTDQVQKAQAALREIRNFAEKNTDDVGDRFAEEARKIHYGDAEARGIRGRSSAADTQALLDEGIEVLPLPAMPEDAN